MENTTTAENSGFMDGAAKLIEYGPIGLAALILIVVLITLVSGQISESKERVLKQAMWVGVGCLAMLLVADYTRLNPTVRFVVNPYALEQFRMLPKPIITVNNEELKAPYIYTFSREATATIDVSNTIDVLTLLQKSNNISNFAISSLSSSLRLTQNKLNQASSALLNVACTPGATTSRPSGLDPIETIVLEAQSITRTANMTLLTASNDWRKTLAEAGFAVSGPDDAMAFEAFRFDMPKPVDG